MVLTLYKSKKAKRGISNPLLINIRRIVFIDRYKHIDDRFTCTCQAAEAFHLIFLGI